MQLPPLEIPTAPQIMRAVFLGLLGASVFVVLVVYVGLPFTP